MLVAVHDPVSSDLEPMMLVPSALCVQGVSAARPGVGRGWGHGEAPLAVRKSF